MKRLKELIDKYRPEDSRRGSALLISLMVMVGLSLLGLSFVGISETEAAISGHERDSNQALDAAETGAKMVVEWFQDAEWAFDTGILPPNDDTIKRLRIVADGSTDRYKNSPPNAKLFDKPFKPNQPDRFFGDEAHADVHIDYTTTVGATFLNLLNKRLFSYSGNVTSGSPDMTDGGSVRITEILVYAPPIIDGNFNSGTGFWSKAGIRYGVATVKVTAKKFRPGDAPLSGTDPDSTVIDGSKAIATRWVRMVVSEWPFPGPQGPIQSNANIQTGGNTGVHWGRMTASGNIEVKNPLVGLNWYDAYDHPHYEHGYDSSDAWVAATTYKVGMIVHPPTPNGFSYVCTRNGISGATAPVWPIVANCVHDLTTCGSVDDPNVAGTAWQQRPIVNYPNVSAGNYDDNLNWLYLISGQTYEDPWAEVRARGQIINVTGSSAPHPYALRSITGDPTAKPQYGYSNWLQYQTTSDITRPADRKQVIFPKITYDFWKEIAVTGAGTQGVYYLRWVSGGDGDMFTDGITTQKFAKWLNTVKGKPAGFYFFDTENRQNPQGAGAPGTLTPEFSVNASDDGNRWQMAGFVYLNAAGFATTGINGPDSYLNFPGEPYRDVGYIPASKATDNAATPPQVLGDIYLAPDGSIQKEGVGNGIWDWEDLKWSNSGTNGRAPVVTEANAEFDVFLANKWIRLPDGTFQQRWLPVEWYPGCHPGKNSVLGADALGCSEPHEPYINLLYPVSGGLGDAKQGGSPVDIPTGWDDPTTPETRIPKKTQSGSPVSCGPTSLVDNCTSAAYDKDGPLTDEITPILNGIMYLEGDMGTDSPLAGNADYFGSLLIQGSVRGRGTPEVWFDEKLIKEEWPPKSLHFPRVYVSAQQTDQ